MSKLWRQWKRDQAVEQIGSSMFATPIAGAFPFIVFDGNDSPMREAIAAVEERCTALTDALATGEITTREQVEAFGWPLDCHVQWIEPHHLSSSLAADRIAAMEQRLTKAEADLAYYRGMLDGKAPPAGVQYPTADEAAQAVKTVSGALDIWRKDSETLIPPKQGS